MRRYVELMLATMGSLAACIHPSGVTCGDLLCPTGSVCLDGSRCATGEAVTACDGLADGASCQTASFTGTCAGGACTASRCGDGIVGGNEQCDGPVTGIDCVQYGFDLGIPDCSEHCDLDLIGGCTRFGWERISPVSARAAWTDGTRLAVIRKTGTPGIDVYTGAQVVSLDHDFTGVAGSPHAIVAWNASEIYESTGGPFTAVAKPTFGGSIGYLAVADDDTIYVAVDIACEVDRRNVDGTWTTIRPLGPETCFALAVTGTDVLIGETAATGGKVWRYQSGTTWTLVFTTPSYILSLAERDGVIWAGTIFDGIQRYANATRTRFYYDSVPSVVVTSNAAYATNTFSSQVTRVSGGLVEGFEAPIRGTLIGDGADGLYTFGNGVYRYRGAEYADRIELTGVIHDIDVLPNGDAIVGNDTSVTRRTDDPTDLFMWSRVDAAIDTLSVAGRASSDVYATNGTALVHCTSTTCTDVTPAGFVAIADLWAPPAGEPSLYAVGADGLAMAKTATTWSTLAPPSGAIGCNLAAITGSASAIVAVGACGATGIAWELAGTMWNEVYRGGTPLASVAVTTDGEIVAAGPDGGAWTVGGVWQPVADARGVSITATTADDVFVGGGPGDVAHWDGLAWSRLSVVGANQPHVAALPHTLYIAGAVDSVLLR